MNNTIQMKPESGVMPIQCPTCKQYKDIGTVFVALNLREKAYVEARRGSIVRELTCHAYQHPVSVVITL